MVLFYYAKTKHSLNFVSKEKQRNIVRYQYKQRNKSRFQFVTGYFCCHNQHSQQNKQRQTESQCNSFCALRCCSQYGYHLTNRISFRRINNHFYNLFFHFRNSAKRFCLTSGTGRNLHNLNIDCTVFYLIYNTTVFDTLFHTPKVLYFSVATLQTRKKITFLFLFSAIRQAV